MVIEDIGHSKTNHLWNYLQTPLSVVVLEHLKPLVFDAPVLSNKQEAEIVEPDEAEGVGPSQRLVEGAGDHDVPADDAVDHGRGRVDKVHGLGRLGQKGLPPLL